jgi:hypothetical protein
MERRRDEAGGARSAEAGLLVVMVASLAVVGSFAYHKLFDQLDTDQLQNMLNDSQVSQTHQDGQSNVELPSTFGEPTG